MVGSFLLTKISRQVRRLDVWNHADLKITFCLFVLYLVTYRSRDCDLYILSILNAFTRVLVRAHTQ